MGWFDWFGSKKAEEPDLSTRKDRQKCWEDRDAYFACLDANGVLKPGEEGKVCLTERNQYDKNCAKSWIDYFNQRRVLAEQQKESLAMAKIQEETAKRKR